MNTEFNEIKEYLYNKNWTREALWLSFTLDFNN